ncbi:Probable galacturonosyltransferase 15 [Striga hermonthica]|uniref:Hexosyltransferase n=1 Tax=Striga hermonthica TaxID=68872 RepID=A0A9N7R5T3_STRHE|nr:Probable galacturonosyltransferase 15 [Striga hermonthica]
MKLCASAAGFKRFAAYGVGRRIWGMKGKNPLAAEGGGRRLSHRPARLLVGLLLPFLFVRAALLALESAALCSSPIACMTWRLFGGSDAALLREELSMALLEATTSGDEDNGGRAGIARSESLNSIPLSFKDLVKDMALNKDIKAFAFKTKAMIARLEHTVKEAKWHESLYWHLAAHGIPKTLHCLSLNLAEEYAVNAAARSRLPQPQYIYRLTDSSFHHVVLLSDNLLAVSVVVFSTIKTSSNPEKLVFHVVTDKKTYPSMHAWFAMNPVYSAVVEVKGLHQYDWSHEVNVVVKEMLEIHHQIWSRYYRSLKMENFEQGREKDRNLDALSTSSISLLNHLRIYLPVLFPDLDKVVLLDDDVVVQRDLSSLWDLNLNQKVAGAVVDSWCGPGCCPGRKYKDYFNFMDPIFSSSDVDPDSCGWLYGVNIFDLGRWRKTNIIEVYHQWLKHSLNSGFELWHPGALPPALLAFEKHVQRIDPSWHLAGLGYRYPQTDKQMLEAAAVVHFSGPAKPWLDIGSSALRDF